MPKARKIKSDSPVQINCVWGHLCSLSSIDQERNNISLFNLIDQLNLPLDFFKERERQKAKIGLFPVSYEIVLLFRKIVNIDTSHELAVDVKIKLVDPSGEVLQETLSPIKFAPGIKRFRARIRSNAVAVTTTGDYVYRVEVKEPLAEDFMQVLNIPFEIVSVG